MSSSLGFFGSQISGHLFTLTGSYDALATVTATSTVSSLVIAGIPQIGYTHLQARITAKSTITTNDDNMYFRFNSDTSSSTSCAWHDIVGSGSGAGTDALTSQSNGFACRATGSGTGSNSATFGIGVLDILDYANPNKNKVARSLSGHDDNGSGYIGLYSSLWMNTAPINTLTFYFPGYNIAAGTSISLYGIK